MEAALSMCASVVSMNILTVVCAVIVGMVLSVVDVRFEVVFVGMTDELSLRA